MAADLASPPRMSARFHSPGKGSRGRLRALLIAGALAAGGSVCATAQVSLYTAVDLALRNSNEVKMAAADVRRAEAGVAQTKDAYLPSLSIGSSLGYSYGFPVGQPSVYNVSAQSLALSFSQPDYIRSARAAFVAAQSALKDTRQRIVQQTASAYLELDADQRELAVMDQQHADGQQLVDIERDRLAAGVDSQMDATRAELQNAQLELRRLHLQSRAALLSVQLAHLTALPETGFATETQSIPPPPDLRGDLRSASEIENSDSGIQSSDASTRSKLFAARGDERQNYRPEIAFGVNYSRYAKFNNYAEYYLRFQHNNFDVGINMNFPLFDAVRRDKARASAADAVHAQAQAGQNRMLFSEQLLQLRGSLDELAAQQKVARLQSEYAREQVEAVLTQLQSGNGGSGAAALTPKDAALARIEERRRAAEQIEADLQLQQAQLGLLRALGTVEQWARQSPRP